MNIEEIREYCLSLSQTEECFPFGEENLVFKTAGKIFAILDIGLDKSMNLKCNPELAIELRERYNFVLPGYHMNKKHWNTININEFIDDFLLKEWILHSYMLVNKSKKK